MHVYILELSFCQKLTQTTLVPLKYSLLDQGLQPKGPLSSWQSEVSSQETVLQVSCLYPYIWCTVQIRVTIQFVYPLHTLTICVLSTLCSVHDLYKLWALKWRIQSAYVRMFEQGRYLHCILSKRISESVLVHTIKYIKNFH